MALTKIQQPLLPPEVIFATNWVLTTGVNLSSLAVDITSLSGNNPVKFTFTPSVPTSAFALTGIPISTNPSNYRVDIDGVLQEPGTDYYISGSNIIFTVPVSSDEKVVVVANRILGSYELPIEYTITPIVYKFTTLTTTSAFTLTGSNLSTSAGNYRVDINGVLQEPNTDYYLSGSNIIFTTPISAGEKVVVVGNQPVGTFDPSFSPVIATGTTTPRTLQNRFADVVNVKDFGAVGDGVTDDSAAIQAAVNTNRPVFFPQGTYKTETTITSGSGGNWKLLTSGAWFTGTASIDSPYPLFGPAPLKIYAKGNTNCILGIAHNDLPSGAIAFPCGVTGYGRNDNNGNFAFGVYAEARQYANTGCVTNEIDSFNHGSAPSSNLPPNRNFSTPEQHPIALTLGAGGTANSSIGIHICKEGGSPQQFLTGIYFNPDSCVNYGIFVDSTSASSHLPLVLKHSVNTLGCFILGSGTPIPNNSVLDYTDGNSVSRFNIKQDGRLGFTSTIVSTSANTGFANTLPANPEGYLKILINGFEKKIPYYAP